MTTTLVVPESISAILRNLAKLDIETGAVLLARRVDASNGDLRLLARELHLVPDEAYELRKLATLRITSRGYIPALLQAEATGTIPIWLHTHPGNGASPRASRYDREVDQELADLFRLRSANEFYGSLIIAQTSAVLRFTGHLESAREKIKIDRLYTVGSCMALARNDSEPHETLGPIFDRNIRAFGGDVQSVLRDLRVAVVGCGGTGSSVAEQLVRLGVRRFLLVDPDRLSESNVTRVYGSGFAEIGRAKVDVLANHIEKIAPDTQIDRLVSTITTESAARKLIGSDVVFACTDDNAGRLVMSRFASYMLTPVIDCGVLLTSDHDGCLNGIHGRVTVLYPGSGCLVCRNRIDLGRAAAEMLMPEERVRRADEGYAPALPNTEPAVIAYTTLVSAFAVSELLERLIHYGPEPTPSEVLLRIHDRQISTNECNPRERHYCHPDSGKLGLGLTEPFLEQTWKN